MPPPSALQAGSLATPFSHLFLHPNPSCRCLQSFLPSHNATSLLSSPSKTLTKTPFFCPLNYSKKRNAIAIGITTALTATAESFSYNIYADTEGASIAQGPDDDVPEPGMQFAELAAGDFWGVELAFQRVPGVTKTETGFSQGFLHDPVPSDVACGNTMHAEVVRVQYDPNECSYETLLDTFWSTHDPTTLNRQGYDMGTQYRSGIYFYTEEQAKVAQESLERQQQRLNKNIVTEILPAKKFYRADDLHQQRLSKLGQSAEKGCKDPIRRYGRLYNA